MNTQMEGKICIVTGATNGIGEVTAQALANMGATVVGVGRNPPSALRRPIASRAPPATRLLNFWSPISRSSRTCATWPR